MDLSKLFRRPSHRAIVLLTVLLTLGGGTGLQRATAQVTDPSVVGQWSGVTSWPIVTIHSHLLPNGKVLAYTSDESLAYVWDPAAGTFTRVPNGRTDLFCSGHSFLADGRLLVVGGHNLLNGIGSKHSNLFDFSTNTWSAGPDMNVGRWYPTDTTLANGDVLVVSGSYDANYTNNNLPQVWQAASNSWRDLTSARLNLPLYPFMHLAPNGKVFNSGPEQTTRYLDTTGTGAWSTVASRTYGYRDYGTSVLYDNGKVLVMGGHDPPTATAEVIDLNAATPAWRSVASMAFARRQHNATILADGKVLVTGGSSSVGFNDARGAVLAAEMWDPATEQWSTLARMQERRLYHSTALLLPDGRVLSSGGGQPAASGGDTDHINAEIYSPPYLFQGARPTITSAPASVSYGQTFAVQTPDATSIIQATWIRLSSVTHAVNMDQRINRLSFSQAAGGLNVVAPSNANLCPPGYYMLFILNSSGVPSVAKIIRIGGTAPVTLPAAPTGLTATAASSSQINLTWTDNANNEVGFKIERSTDGINFTQIATTGATTYVNTSLAAVTTYYYRVRAYNTGSNSAYSNTANATTSAAVPPGTGTGLQGEYYDNLGFTGLKVTRVDPTVNFGWGLGSPDPLIAVDTFSVRWSGQVQPQFSETYTFYTQTDDGVRLWVNNQLIIDKWINQGTTEWSGTISLNAGQKYDIKMEYYDSARSAVARLSWSSPRTTKAIIPQSQLYPAVTLPVTLPAAPGNLTATAASSSQVNLTWTDNASNEDGFKIERSTDGTNFTQVAAVGANVASYANTGLAAATIYYYRVRAYNTAGDSLYSNTTSATTTVLPLGTGLQGAYYDNVGFTGLKVTRLDPTVNFGWGLGSPDPLIAVDTFSVRWSGQVQPQFSETYTFYTQTDDGVRLWVNNQLIIDKWINQGTTEWSGTISLNAGQKYDIKMEFYDNARNAVARLSWSSPRTPKGIIPQTQLFPSVTLPVTLSRGQ